MTFTVASISVENSLICMPYLTAWRVYNFKPRYTIRHTGLLQHIWLCKILTSMSKYFHIDSCHLLVCCRTECVSRGVFQMIREAPNGSLWVSEEEKPLYQVIIPSRQSLRDEWIMYGKNTPTETCPWKRSLSVTSEKMGHRKRHENVGL